MATVSKREILPIEPIVEYTLTLNADEAQLLTDILSGVGGLPTETRRGISADILRSLEKAGLKYRQYHHRDWTGAIIFQKEGA